MKKENPKLKNPVYTENLLTCSSILCGCISRVLLDDPDFADRINKETSIIPAYTALKASIERITEDESAEIVDKNQLKLEL